MSTSLLDVMQLGVLSGARVISASPLTGSTRDPSTMALIHAGEVCLVDAQHIRDRHGLVSFVQGAAQKHAVAVISNLAESPDSPLNTLNACDLPVPLIVPPRGTGLREVADAIRALILERHEQAEKVCSDLGAELIQAFAAGLEPHQVARLLGRRLRRACALIESVEPGLPEMGESEALFADSCRALDGAPALLIPVRSGVQALGCVAASGRAGEFTGIDVYMLRYAAQLCAMYFVGRKALSQTEVRLKGDFVWSLGRGAITDIETARTRAKSLGYDPERHYCAVVFLGSDLRPRPGQRLSAEVMSGVDTQRERVIHAIERTAEVLGKRIMLTEQDAIFLVFVDAEGSTDLSDIVRFAERVVETAGKSGGPVLTAGVGRVKPDLLGLSRSYQEAHDAARVGVVVRGKRSVTCYNDLGPYRLLVRLCGDQEAFEFCEQYLGRISDYDRRRKGELLRTLSCYLNNGANVSAAARELHLHRQSLIYRLERIEQLTGRSLQDAQDRFVLHLALKMLDIMKLA